MSEQMNAIRGILGDALSDLTPQQLVDLTMEPFESLREEAVDPS